MWTVHCLLQNTSYVAGSTVVSRKMDGHCKRCLVSDGSLPRLLLSSRILIVSHLVMSGVSRSSCPWLSLGQVLHIASLLVDRHFCSRDQSAYKIYSWRTKTTADQITFIPQLKFIYAEQWYMYILTRWRWMVLMFDIVLNFVKNLVILD